jgi:protein-S-isoprenylcysteine O-methyltransferase Ste14
MGRIIGFLYGLAAYSVFLGASLYAIGFVTNLWVPKAIDTGSDVPIDEALVINMLLMSLFAIQHSVMARPVFKKWWTQFVPVSVERSTYVLLASLALILLFWQWRPIPTIVWQITTPKIAMVVLGLSLCGWLLVLVSTLLINHFELFGLQQVVRRRCCFLGPNEVVTLPGGVDQHEIERLGRAQIANLVLVTRWHGAEPPHRHSPGSGFLPNRRLRKTNPMFALAGAAQASRQGSQRVDGKRHARIRPNRL